MGGEKQTEEAGGRLGREVEASSKGRCVSDRLPPRKDIFDHWVITPHFTSRLPITGPARPISKTTQDHVVTERGLHQRSCSGFGRHPEILLTPRPGLQRTGIQPPKCHVAESSSDALRSLEPRVFISGIAEYVTVLVGLFWIYVIVRLCSFQPHYLRARQYPRTSQVIGYVSMYIYEVFADTVGVPTTSDGDGVVIVVARNSALRADCESGVPASSSLPTLAASVF